jgi:hypothetical protein
MEIRHKAISTEDHLIDGDEWNDKHSVAPLLYGYELVEEKNLPAGTTTTTFSNLDGNEDEEYLIEYEGVMSHSTTQFMKLFPNSITNNQFGAYFGWGTIGGLNHNPASVTYIPFAIAHTGQIKMTASCIIKAKTGTLRTFNGECLDILASTFENYTFSGVWNETITNLTSLVIAPDVGTFSGTIRLWKRIPVEV